MKQVTAAPLPSWNDGKVKQSIEAFVQRVTTADGKDFLPPAERIAVFDNDGTLWPENPVPFQLAFLLECFRSRHAALPGPAGVEYDELLRGQRRSSGESCKAWRALFTRVSSGCINYGLEEKCASMHPKRIHDRQPDWAAGQG